MSKPIIIALYLPQYHPIPENDNWFGKGFTEWTNVGKAKPLFKGHYQPKVPADLGYYDLRLHEIREQQAELAREAGITAFCYWHYWFGNGKQLLERPFNEVLKSGQPDFPFCLGWANHSWIAKVWDNRKEDKIIQEQLYPGKDDYLRHFEYALKAFKDPRYLKIKGRPVFYIFQPLDVPVEFLDTWQTLAKQNGFEDGICFIGRLGWPNLIDKAMNMGYRYVTLEKLDNYIRKVSLFTRRWHQLKNKFFRGYRNCFKYETMFRYFIDEEIESKSNVIPMIMPNWDHSPRSKGKNVILHDARPDYFYEQVKMALNVIKDKAQQDKILLLKSWNEWGEGNYMEPDLKYGKGYIKALRAALDGKSFEKQ